MRTPEGRGGARVPSGGPRVSGVGRFARRSDAQPINVPNVGDSEDLRQGDRAKLEAAQRQRPLARAPSPRVAAPRGGNSPAAAGGQVGGAPLPPHLVEMETTRPMEDELTPASPAPIEPMDDKEVVLQFLIDTFQDANASQMLNDIRASRQAPDVPMQPTTFAPDLPPEVTEEPGEPEAIELGEQPPVEGVVEEEAPVV